MAQIVIDGVLFSPVLAHALEPGDLIDGGVDSKPVRVLTATREGRHMRVTDTADTYHLSLNHPVLRAVGARAGRGGAR